MLLTMNDIVAKASADYAAGFYCSQAVLGAFCERYGMDITLARRVSCGLNSGVRNAGICGAVTGAVLVIGLRYGESPTDCNQKVEEFIGVFRERNRSIICRDLLGCDIFTPEGKENAVNNHLFATICRDMVVSATQILCELGYGDGSM